MSSIFRSLAFYLVFYAATVVFVLLALLALPLGSSKLRAVASGWSAFHRSCTRAILGIGVVEQGKRPAVQTFYALKHESFFEAIELTNLLGDPVAFAKSELFRIPLWGWAARAYGTVPVARAEGASALRYMLSEAKRFKETGRHFAIFPEGTRVLHGSSPRLRSGFAGLYKVLALPVVPVAVDSGPAYAGWWKRRGTITLRFGEPVPPGLARAEVEARVRAGINALNSAHQP